MHTRARTVGDAPEWGVSPARTGGMRAGLTVAGLTVAGLTVGSALEDYATALERPAWPVAAPAPHDHETQPGH